MPQPTGNSNTFVPNPGTTPIPTPTPTVTPTPNAADLINDAPEMMADQNYTIAEDSQLNFTLAGATDPEDDDIYYEIVLAPTKGSLSGCLNSADEQETTCTYTPDANTHGADSFIYRAHDRRLHSETNSTVSITITSIEDRPIISSTSDCNVTLDERDNFVCDVALSAIDPDNQAATITWSKDASDTCSWATLNPTTGAVTGTPTDLDVGTCSLKVIADDGDSTSITSSYNITINNLIPIFTAFPTTTQYAMLNTAISILENTITTDHEGVSGTYSITSSDLGDNCSDHDTLLSIDASTGAITYAPTINYSGVCYIAVTFTDAHGTYVTDEIKINVDNFIETDWTRLQANVSDAPTYSTAVDSDGNVYVVGQTFDDLFGETLSGGTSAYLIKYSETGTRLWTKIIGTDSSANQVLVDDLDNVYVMGATAMTFEGDAIIGTGAAFIIKYDSSGIKQWHQLTNTTAGEDVYFTTGVIIGNILYVAGNTTGDVYGSVVVGVQQGVVIKYDLDGNRSWTELIGAAGGTTRVTDLKIRNDELYVIGNVDVSINGEAINGVKDLFLVKYDSDGDQLLTKLFGEAGLEINAKSLTLDSTGNIYFTGSTLGVGTFYGNAVIDPRAFILKTSDAGIVTDTIVVTPSVSTTGGIDIFCSDDDSIFLIGNTAGNIGVKTKTGTNDLFISKWNQTLTSSSNTLFGVAATGTYGSAAFYKDSDPYFYVVGSALGDLNGENHSGSEAGFIIKALIP